MFTTAQNSFNLQKPSYHLGVQGLASQNNVSHPENIPFKRRVLSLEEIEKLPQYIPKASKLAQKIPESWLKSSWFKSIAELGANNQPLLDTITTLGLTTTLRPAAILATPGADKENREYSAAQSICSGIVAFIFGFLIYSRCKNAIKNQAELAAKSPTINFPIKDSNEYSAYSTVVTNSVKTFFSLFEGAVLFALVPFIMKKLFPKRNKKMDLAPVYAAKLSDDQQRVYHRLMEQSLTTDNSNNLNDSPANKRSGKALWV